MTRPDDSQLIKFLHQHRSDIPPASVTLEEQIMQTIAAEPKAGTVPKSPAKVVSLSSRQRQLWGTVSVAVAASLLVIVGGYRAAAPVKPTTAELATLEKFLEASWVGAVDQEAEETIGML